MLIHDTGAGRAYRAHLVNCPECQRPGCGFGRLLASRAGVQAVRPWTFPWWRKRRGRR